MARSALDCGSPAARGAERRTPALAPRRVNLHDGGIDIGATGHWVGSPAHQLFRDRPHLPRGHFLHDGLVGAQVDDFEGGAAFIRPVEGVALLDLHDLAAVSYI